MKPIKITRKQARIFVVAASSILIIALFSLLYIFLFQKQKNNDYGMDLKGQVILPDITGYTEKDGIEELENSGFKNIKTEYIYDQFTNDGCIIKMNYHIRSILDPDEEIIIYICDESLIKDSKNEMNNEIKADTTYSSLNQIEIIDLKIKDGKFYAIIRNNNQDAVKNITYKISYLNKKGEQIGGSTYLIDGAVILPGEKLLFSENINRYDVESISFHSFSYQTQELPENER